MPRPAIRPRELPADELATLDTDAARLGRELGVSTTQTVQILARTRAISADTTARLGRWSGTRPDRWSYAQATYDRRAVHTATGEETPLQG